MPLLGGQVFQGVRIFPEVIELVRAICVGVAGYRAGNLLRAPFSSEKIIWAAKSKRVIDRSRGGWHPTLNFEFFTAREFLAAAVERIPPKNQHTIPSFSSYSNEGRGMEVEAWEGVLPIWNPPPSRRPLRRAPATSAPSGLISSSTSGARILSTAHAARGS